ncbi:maleylpyruvate isomerase family mycothiol-dependent enzyme [Allobranchiibius sp. CTAmp26]|uniref:maleylpyruvate isomerase family mycothiol-dependent enzyme n=1 Tax=Allobranchiibius sp. CTAmp26 TaxID=2815214 RepID=UPI001AA14304|nr:maleylpyruvate isomerase family mycothiol-dependent enzyme [Allobranchiibius sp. CTAmp26]MBO1756076.1 maleylpyruvate isomerase family mycothiol-dependent enzyme [Allobranchiibius sp. CTAmp26]
MASTLTFETYLDGIQEATARLREEAWQAGSLATVPTCPQWNVGHLVAHQGMVHRWAAGVLAGGPATDTEEVEREGLETTDPGVWLQDGCDQLVGRLRATPDDADVSFFMDTPLSGRDSWARRQCHETTIHSIDALAARLGQPAEAEEVDLSPGFAVDGVDELLCSFMPRRKFDLRSSGPVSVTVHTIDTGDSWLLSFGQDLPVVQRDRTTDHPDAAIEGSAVALYLALWNRGSQIRAEGRDVLSLWRDRMKVTWD